MGCCEPTTFRFARLRERKGKPARLRLESAIVLATRERVNAYLTKGLQGLLDRDRVKDDRHHRANAGFRTSRRRAIFDLDSVMVRQSSVSKVTPTTPGTAASALNSTVQTSTGWENHVCERFLEQSSADSLLPHETLSGPARPESHRSDCCC